MDKELWENFNRGLYRLSSHELPFNQGTVLLGKLITDQRMKDVWEALAKRIEEDIELYQFFHACEGGILGWQSSMKQTALKRKKFYQDIRDTALKLASLMKESDQLNHYPTNILLDISEKAKQYGKEEPLAKKPNSDNADIHYFARWLSEYLKKRYGQPLHDVVAATTEVACNRLSIDSDYVRKLVS